jgi:hypothetical protein
MCSEDRYKKRYTAELIDGLYPWTFITNLGRSLALAEELYGRRDMSWTILGVEVAAKGPPNTWYPSHYPDSVLVRVSTVALENSVAEIFELAHEAFHLLMPRKARPTNILEEGAASRFSVIAVRRLLQDDHEVKHPAYASAKRLVDQLVGDSGDVVLRNLRRRQSNFRDLSVEDILEVVPDAPRALAEQLLQPFDPDTP